MSLFNKASSIRSTYASETGKEDTLPLAASYSDVENRGVALVGWKVFGAETTGNEEGPTSYTFSLVGSTREVFSSTSLVFAVNKSLNLNFVQALKKKENRFREYAIQDS